MNKVIPVGFTQPQRFEVVDWSAVPDETGMYIIYDEESGGSV